MDVHIHTDRYIYYTMIYLFYSLSAPHNAYHIAVARVAPQKLRHVKLWRYLHQRLKLCQPLMTSLLEVIYFSFPCFMFVVYESSECNSEATQMADRTLSLASMPRDCLQEDYQ